MVVKSLTDEQVKHVVFTPNDAVKIALSNIEQRRNSRGAGIRLGLPSIDNYLLPGRPGELITVMGMSSNYKSGLMQYWSRQIAQEIKDNHAEDECVVYISWEQAIEEMMAFDLAFSAKMNATEIYQGRVNDEELERLRLAAFKRIVFPVWLIGHSVEERADRPMLSLTAVKQGLDYLADEFGMKPRAIFLDYLQQIEPEDGADRRMQVFDMVRRCKNLALSESCPVVMGVQAGRGVYERSWGIPGMHEALETSNIEHTSDKILAVWMPKQTHQEGSLIDAKRRGETITLRVTENLLILQVLKQKMGPSGLWWPLHVDPTINEVHEMRTEAIEGER